MTEDKRTTINDERRAVSDEGKTHASSFIRHSAPLIDTHCHLNFDRFDRDREAVVARAVKMGVTAMINPGVDLRSSRAAIALAERYEPVYAAVGIHPTSTDGLDQAALRALREMAQHPKVVAIGEIGLDYYWPDQPNRDWPCASPSTQRAAFRRQLDLAAELGLPVIIHDREAHTDVMIGLEDSRGVSGVLHSFSGDLDLAEWAIDLGFYVGITGPVTFRRNQELKTVARQIDFERLLVETDAPFLTPAPYRGRNEPAYVHVVAQEIARLRGCDLPAVAQQTSDNARTLFQRLRVRRVRMDKGAP
jgi:TatD DNase family protein